MADMSDPSFILPPTSTGYLPYRGYKTWYAIWGTLPPPSAYPLPPSQPRPLLVVPGGPGAGHNYLLPLSDLSKTHNIPVITYDSIGCGNSTILRNKDVGVGFWTLDLYVEELQALLDHLGVKEWDVLGNSFGGMLVAEHALSHPAGLKHMVVACSLATTTDWGVASQLWRDKLPDNGGAIMRKHELEGTTGSEESKHWTEEFNARHECRVVPMPEYVRRTFEILDENPDAGEVMIGPSNVDITGTLSTYTLIPRLPLISTPTLVYWGKYDVGQEICTKPFAELIPGAVAFKFLQGSHMPHVEQRGVHMRLVGDWLVGKGLAGSEEGVLERLK
ncbi:proline-specific peptidase [Dacryopinax primogenitus]|uniref:Proline-specific peptidase n=1 Tax=Dacryopinax primogenitus (strain DJM 731) TaxID=1858805 RepID=M5G361_DACPD|nr:proline-specific peptidase [Dacryopinax primogenitus]EJU04656.1 proline-specific peptidase [Dacryopinax primogenitus]